MYNCCISVLQNVVCSHVFALFFDTCYVSERTPWLLFNYRTILTDDIFKQKQLPWFLGILDFPSWPEGFPLLPKDNGGAENLRSGWQRTESYDTSSCSCTSEARGLQRDLQYFHVYNISILCISIPVNSAK